MPCFAQISGVNDNPYQSFRFHKKNSLALSLLNKYWKKGGGGVRPPCNLFFNPYLYNTLDEVAVSAAKKTYIPVVEGIPTSLFLDSGFQCGGNFFPLNLEGREEMAPSLTL